MSILTDPLPAHVTVDGENYKIDTDFTTSIRFEQLMLDPTIDDMEKIALAVNLYYPVAPPNMIAAIEQAQWFYAGGDDPLPGAKGKGGSGKRVYDYDYDAPYIYAAFRADYGIDLQCEPLHWWAFRALFLALREDHTICKIMGYRSMDISKLRGEERKMYRALQQQYALPRPKAEQEKIDQINDILLHGGDLDAVLGRGKRN